MQVEQLHLAFTHWSLDMLGHKYGILPLCPSLRIALQGKTSVVYTTISAPLQNGLNLSRSGLGKVWNAPGVIVNVAIDTPRYDHDVQTGMPNGLLLEAAATNILPHSVANVSNWNADNCSPVSLSLNALGLFPGVSVPSSGAVWSRLKQDNIRLTSGQTYAITCYVRAGTSPSMRFAISGNGGETHVAGPIGSLSNSRQDLGKCSAIVEITLADGETRQIKFLFTSSVSGNYQMGVGPQSATLGQDVILLGIQAEEGETHSSFIETGSMPEARAADVLSLSDLTGTYDLLLSYSDRADVLISAANVTPGYALPSHNAHLVSVIARPS